MKSRFALVAMLALLAIQANAEVRLQAGSTELDLVVEPMPQGVWTPSGASHPYTINPQGDVLGDGFPAHASADERLVAAWQRPAHQAVVVLRATHALSMSSLEVATTDGVGLPIVTSLDGRFLVTWQSGSGSPLVNAVVASDVGVSAPVSILSGRLIGVYRVGDTVHVVALDSVGGALNVGTIPALWDPNPIPIGLSRVPLTRAFGAAPLEVTPPPEFVTSPATWQPCVDERGAEVLVAWQAGCSVIGRVTLDAYGVHGGSEFFRGPNGSCQAVLNAASRH